MKKMLSVLVAVVSAAIMQSVQAVDGVWVNESAASADWADAANWNWAGSGDYPSGADASATLNVPTTVWQNVLLPKVTSFEIGTVLGNMYHRLGSPTSTAYGRDGRTVKFGDTSDYKGSLYANRTFTTFEFSGAVANVRVADLSVNLRPTVKVPSGTTVTVDSVYSGGAIEKSGDGKLVLGTTAVGDSIVAYHAAGTLELNGRSETAASVPAGNPVFWVDASKTNLMSVTHDDASGRDYVEAWYDCRKADGVHVKAAMPRKDIAKPWIAERTANGLAMLDFGAFENNSAATVLGQSAAMEYDLGTNAREVFLVVRQKGTSPAFFIGQGGDNTMDFHRGMGNNTLLDAGYASAKVRNGIIRLDGNDAAATSYVYGDTLHIIDYGMVDGGLKPDLFCGDRKLARNGGAAIAEAIFYADELTAAERAQTTAYLRSKWFGCEMDLEVLKTESASTPVSVPAGRVASVSQAIVGGNKLVKQGEGLLKVGRFQTKVPEIEVQGGAVGFDAAVGPVATDVPAADPVFWGDATKDTFEFVQGSDKLVSKWKDCRAGSSASAVAQEGASGKYPFISDDTCNGKRLLDLGTEDSEKTWMKANVSNVREGFALVRITKGTGFFGCLNLQLAGSGDQSVLAQNAFNEPNAGLWTVNGVTYNPTVWGAFVRNTSQYYVVSFSSEAGTTAENIGTENGYVVGCRRYGELIYYNRRLTDLERRQTIAYLMKKWRNETYDYATTQSRIDKMVFPAENLSPRIHAEVDTTVGSAQLNGQDSFAKTGAGKLTVEDAVFPTAMTKLEVDGELDFGGTIDAMPEMAFHVDASKYGTFEFSGDGKDGSTISKWYDCRGNGLYAKGNVAPDKGTAEPIYRVVGSSGEGGLLGNMPYVDLSENKGMYWYDASGAQQTFTDTVEYHAVFRRCRDVSSATLIGGPLDGTAAWNNKEHLVPSSQWNPFWAYAAGNATAANKRLDNKVWHTANTYTGDSGGISTAQFYVFSVVLTSGKVRAYSFGITAGTSFDGMQLCEAMVLRGSTNTMERATRIHGYLTKKWKGMDIGTEEFKTGFGEVRMGSQAKICLNSDLAFETPTLTGNGSFDAKALTGVTRLDVGIDATGAVDSKTIDGTVEFAGALSVAFDVANVRRVKAGQYVLLKAKGGFVNKPSSVTVTGLDAVAERRPYQVTLTDDEIVVEFGSKGLIIVVQ